MCSSAQGHRSGEADAMPPLRISSRRVLLVAMLPVAVAFACPRPASACDPAVPAADLVKPGTLIMSTNPTLPPLQFVDSSGDLKGMRIELGTEIAKRLCLNPEYVR